MMTLTVVQPKYYSPAPPDAAVAEFLLKQLENAPEGGLILLPEYSNAGGLSDPELERAAMARAGFMREKAAQTAKEKQAYVAINVLEERDGKVKNSTYLYGKQGQTVFVYDKIHLPPSEVALGMERGTGSCFCEVDGLRIGFMTCYDAYYFEQIEHLAAQKPDIILLPSCQRGERTDIIRALTKLTAFRCNCYVLRASFSMDSEERGGCSMIVAPDGQILEDMGMNVGAVSTEADLSWKYMRTAGFGCGMVRCDDFINMGLCPELFPSKNSNDIL